MFSSKDLDIKNDSLVKNNEDKIADVSVVVCRICFSGDISGAFGEGDMYGTNLLNSCACTGSCGYYHRYCLEEWMNKANTRNCELCKETFYTKKEYPPLSSFFCDIDNAADIQGFLNSIFFLILINLFNYALCFYFLPPLINSPPADEFKYDELLAWKIMFKTPIFFFIFLMLTLIFWWKTGFMSFYNIFIAHRKKNTKYRLCNKDKTFAKFLSPTTSMV
uniref:RING-CH-type domain-containing protein n=1 Tax=Parastrongyloides trichosuri TaxID=131310 RepID=A0A0N4ZS04_PARTI